MGFTVGCLWHRALNVLQHHRASREHHNQWQVTASVPEYPGSEAWADHWQSSSSYSFPSGALLGKTQSLRYKYSVHPGHSSHRPLMMAAECVWNIEHQSLVLCPFALHLFTLMALDQFTPPHNLCALNFWLNPFGYCICIYLNIFYWKSEV